MPEPGEGGGSGETFTQDQVEQLVAERIEEANKGLQENRDRVLGELKQAKDRLKQLDGIDPEEVEALRQFRAEAERKEAEATGDWKAREEQIRKEMAAAAKKDHSKLSERVEVLQTALEEKLIDSEAVAAIAELKGSTKVLLPHVKKFVKVEEGEDGFRAVVVDDRGMPRVGDSAGNPMSIKQLVEDMRQDPDFARNFEGSGSSGGGASRSTASGSGRNRIAADDPDAFLANLKEIASGEVEVQ